MNFCKNCAYYEHVEYTLIEFWCLHNSITKRNYITGETYYSRTLCAQVRGDKDHCGYYKKKWWRFWE